MKSIIENVDITLLLAQPHFNWENKFIRFFYDGYFKWQQIVARLYNNVCRKS